MKQRRPPSGSEEAETCQRQVPSGESQLARRRCSPVEWHQIDGADDDRSGPNAFCSGGKVMSSGYGSQNYRKFAVCKVHFALSTQTRSYKFIRIRNRTSISGTALLAMYELSNYLIPHNRGIASI